MPCEGNGNLTEHYGTMKSWWIRLQLWLTVPVHLLETLYISRNSIVFHSDLMKSFMKSKKQLAYKKHGLPLSCVPSCALTHTFLYHTTFIIMKFFSVWLFDHLILFTIYFMNYSLAKEYCNIWIGWCEFNCQRNQSGSPVSTSIKTL